MIRHYSVPTEMLEGKQEPKDNGTAELARKKCQCSIYSGCQFFAILKLHTVDGEAIANE